MANRIKYQVQDVTIPVGSNQKEVNVILDGRFQKCVGYAIPAPLDPANVIHTKAFNFALSDDHESIQDRTPAADLIFTPSVAVSDRYKKADFTAAGRTIRIKLDTNGVNVTGTDFVVSVIFQLQNP